MTFIINHWFGIIFLGYTIYWIFTNSFCKVCKKYKKALESEGTDYELDLFCCECCKKFLWRLGIFVASLILSIIINWHSFSDVVKGDIVKLIIMFSMVLLGIYCYHKIK
jgi:hypothetical protein